MLDANARFLALYDTATMRVDGVMTGQWRRIEETSEVKVMGTDSSTLGSAPRIEGNVSLSLRLCIGGPRLRTTRTFPLVVTLVRRWMRLRL